MPKVWTILLGALLTITNSWGQNNMGPIGQWREHYNNHSVKQIVKGDKLYGASWQQVFSVDEKNNITYIGKSNGLSEEGIECIQWHALSQQLIVAYNNSSIDIINGDQIYKINDILLTNLYADNTINDIYLLDKWALVSTNFGIVVIDLDKREIKDTWFPNNNRQSTITYQVSATTDSLYVATEQGIYTAPINNNWIVPNKWTNLSAFNNLGIKKITKQQATVFAYNNSSIFQLPNLTPYTNFSNQQIRKIVASTEGLLVILNQTNNKGRVVKLNGDKSITTLVDTNTLATPTDILTDQNGYWIADSTKGLLLKSTNTTWLPLAGPSNPIKGKMAINDPILVAPFGNNIVGYATYDAAGWTNYAKFNNTELPIISSTAIDTKDASFWFTANNNLIHINPSTNKIENSIPSLLNGALNDIQIASDGTIWVIKEGNGLLMHKNNVWTLHAPPSDYEKNGLKSGLVSAAGQVWMIAPNAQGLYAFQSTQNYPTAVWRKFTTARGNGNLPSNTIKAVLEDKMGSIWIGTDKGIGIINCGDLSSYACDAYLPIVSNYGFASTLFQNTNINTITVDGANRKWVGTNNGAWLISAEGTTIIEHFSADNSPLATDTIYQILVHPTSGEVFFNTSNGMASYRGTATEGAATQASIVIYPNPVSPNYTGTIAFKGLVNNAIVKITDLNGRLVHQTRALGGQAVWNGITYEGQRIASGIYLVFVRDEFGTEKHVGKLVITSGL